MKQIKEIKFEELSTDQKLGMSTIAFCWDDVYCDVDYVEQLIKNHSLGGVWITPRDGANKHIMKRLKEAADYPLLFFTDAENGWGEYKIGRQNAVGMTGSEDAAYVFGKLTALGIEQQHHTVNKFQCCGNQECDKRNRGHFECLPAALASEILTYERTYKRAYDYAPRQEQQPNQHSRQCSAHALF